MKITQDVRDYAAAVGVSTSAAIDAGLASKAAEFREAGKQIYVPSPIGDDSGARQRTESQGDGSVG